MSFGQELKEFVAGFQAGWKMTTDQEYRQKLMDNSDRDAALAERRAGQTDRELDQADQRIAGDAEDRRIRENYYNSRAIAESGIDQTYENDMERFGVDFDGNDLSQEFDSTLATGDPENGLMALSNPVGRAAVVARGFRESGFHPKNVFGSWDDLGDTSGLAMSWRGDRLTKARDFAALHGDDGNRPSITTQAKFMLAEDPRLIAALNQVKTPEEATRLVANAWRFKGYDQPGTGEYAAYEALTRRLADRFRQPQAIPTDTDMG